MDSEDEKSLSHSQTKLLSALRSDLLAALAAFDRAQDWAVRIPLCSIKTKPNVNSFIYR